MAEQARVSGIASLLWNVRHALYGETAALGHRGDDMVTKLRAVEARTA